MNAIERVLADKAWAEATVTASTSDSCTAAPASRTSRSVRKDRSFLTKTQDDGAVAIRPLSLASAVAFFS